MGVRPIFLVRIIVVGRNVLVTPEKLLVRRSVWVIPPAQRQDVRVWSRAWDEDGGMADRGSLFSFLLPV